MHYRFLSHSSRCVPGLRKGRHVSLITLSVNREQGAHPGTEPYMLTESKWRLPPLTGEEPEALRGGMISYAHQLPTVRWSLKITALAQHTRCKSKKLTMINVYIQQ